VRQPTIAETALQLIRARGPLTLDELAPLVVAAGRTHAKDPRRAVEGPIAYDARFLEGANDSWHAAIDQLEGAIFTVRPTDLERLEGIVLVRDDLVLATRLLAWELWEHPDRTHLHSFDHHFDLPRWNFERDEDATSDLVPSRTIRSWIGDERAEDLLGFMDDLGVARGHDDEARLRRLMDRTSGMRVIHGARGWMPELEPHQLLGLRVERGEVHAIAVDRRQVIGPHVDASAQRIAGMAQRAMGPDATWFRPSVSLETLLGWVATEAPELFRRPLPPIADVVRRGGLELQHGYVHHRAGMAA
jgi:hypothetical protein